MNSMPEDRSTHKEVLEGSNRRKEKDLKTTVEDTVGKEKKITKDDYDQQLVSYHAFMELQKIHKKDILHCPIEDSIGAVTHNLLKALVLKSLLGQTEHQRIGTGSQRHSNSKR